MPAGQAILCLNIMPTIGQRHLITGYRSLEHITMPQAETVSLKTPLPHLQLQCCAAAPLTPASWPNPTILMKRPVASLALSPSSSPSRRASRERKYSTVPLEPLVEYPSINWTLYEFPRYLVFQYWHRHVAGRSPRRSVFDQGSDHLPEPDQRWCRCRRGAEPGALQGAQPPADTSGDLPRDSIVAIRQHPLCSAA